MTIRPIHTRRAILLLAIAVVFDLLSFVPGVGKVTALFGQAILAGLFYFSGVNVLRDRPAALYAIATLAEIVPYVSLLPVFVTQTVVIIALSRRRTTPMAH